jgi:cobalt/nickel transport protein
MADHVMTKKRSHSLSINLVLIALVVAITVAPLLIMEGSEFRGTDDAAKRVIQEIDTDYGPWISPFFEPGSGKGESLLFMIQAAIGAGVLAYGLIYLRGHKRNTYTEKAND